MPPSSEPGPFDTDHDDLRYVLAINSALSRCLPAGTTADAWDMTVGHTQLFLYEKRAVAWRGQLLRLWAAHTWVRAAM